MSKRMRNALVAGGLLTALLLVTHSYHPIPNVPPLPKLQSPFVSDHQKEPEAPTHIPKRIWQTWREPPQTLADDYKEWSSSWIKKNPGYRYELLTDDAALEFVRTAFHQRPDIIDTYLRTEDIILRADYTRYLALLADGGTYVDMDTDCTRPIDEWIPKAYEHQVGFVVGVEYDALDGDIRSDFEDRVQLCQWAFMARPNNKVLAHIVDRVTRKLQSLAPNGGRIIVEGNDDVLHVTGPRIFSHAIFEALSAQLHEPVTEANLTHLTTPKMIGDTLFLNVNAFGSGQAHSDAKDADNDEQLLWHHFNGFWGWKDAHDGQRDREKEAAEKAAKEKEEAEQKAEESKHNNKRSNFEHDLISGQET